MDVKARQLELNADVADLLEARAAALGMSVANLLAAIAGQGANAALPRSEGLALSPAVGGAGSDGASDVPTDLAASERARAGRRWGEVKAWIDSWGKPDELPRPKLGKL